MNKTLLPLLHKVKSYFSHIDVYRHDTDSGEVDEKMLDEYTNKGIQAIQLIERLVKNSDSQTSIRWHSVGNLPEENKDVLICTKFGQVNEGFLVKKDIDRPYITSEGKVSFEDYEKGGKWYRYRYSDIIDMEDVIAWTYMPEYKEDENNG